MPKMRIVSLLASGTEIVCALGAGDSLVGRSHECDNPPWVRKLPQCSSPAFAVETSSGEIDAEVRRRVRAGEPLYYVDTDRIAKLQADVVIAQVHCDVCAVTPSDVHWSTPSPAPRMLTLSASTVEEIFGCVLQVGQAIGAEQAACDLVSSLRARVSEINRSVRGCPRRRVAAIEWTDPIFTMGNWAPELVEIAGGEPAFGKRGQYSTTIDFAELQDADADVLVIAPCGFKLDRAWQDRFVMERYPGWFDLRAVRERRVAFADGNLYFNRAGITAVDTAVILADIIHGRQDAGRTAWRWYEPTGDATP